MFEVGTRPLATVRFNLERSLSFRITWMLDQSTRQFAKLIATRRRSAGRRSTSMAIKEYFLKADQAVW